MNSDLAVAKARGDLAEFRFLALLASTDQPTVIDKIDGLGRMGAVGAYSSKVYYRWTITDGMRLALGHIVSDVKRISSEDCTASTDNPYSTETLKTTWHTYTSFSQYSNVRIMSELTSLAFQL